MRELTMRYTHARRIGYGRFAVDMRPGIERRGIKVYDGIEGDPGEGIESIEYGKTENVVWFAIPSHALGWLDGQRNHIFTMWEATHLPEAMRENIGNFETVIVPSEQNRELFSHYHDNVQVCPLGVDPDQWHYVPRPEPHPHFNFMVAGSGTRKGADIAYAAFARAFPDWQDLTPTPHLIHKSPRGVEHAAPWLSTISTYLSDEEEVALYGQTHCYLAPSRGEGFGLQPLQAMAQGIPTILTNAHGHAAFAHLGWPIEAWLEPAATFMLGTAGEWWEPRADKMAEAMRAVYDDYAAALVRAKGAAEVVAQRFTVERMVERMLEILPADLGPYTGSGKWTTGYQRLYRVVTNRDWTGEVAGNVIQCEKGVEYYLPADTKRVLYDHGGLDPVCIEYEINRGKPVSEWVDTGLTAGQERDWEKRRDAPRACFTCGQVMGSSVQFSDLFHLQREVARLERELAEAKLVSV